jgi:hypothetical protein
VFLGLEWLGEFPLAAIYDEADGLILVLSVLLWLTLHTIASKEPMLISPIASKTPFCCLYLREEDRDKIYEKGGRDENH